MKKYLTIPALAAMIATPVALAGPAAAATPHTVKITVTCHYGKRVGSWNCSGHIAGKNTTKGKLPQVVFNAKHNRFSVQPANGTSLSHVAAREHYTRSYNHGFSGQPDQNVPLYRHVHGHRVNMLKLTLSAHIDTFGIG